MSRDKGQPSGTNKSEDSIKQPNRNSAENNQNDQVSSQNDDGAADHIREMNPNRNTGKEDATNIGGYKQ